MPRAEWPLVHDQPAIEVVLSMAQGGQKVTRQLLADTGAGKARAPFEILLDENDCLLCGGSASYFVSLGGAYTGTYPVYLLRIEIPLLGLAGDFRTVGVQTTPVGLDGIACFRFLNQFTYGNFGNRNEFGLEV